VAKPTGPQFTAEAESVVNEFDVDAVGRYFRLRECMSDFSSSAPFFE
jgi:hypothetical protein